MTSAPPETRPGLPAVLHAFGAAARARGRRSGLSFLAFYLMPVAILSVIGVALEGYSEPSFAVGVVDRAETPESRALAAALDAEPTLRVRPLRDEEALQRAVFRGRLGAGLVIPPGWRPQGAAPLVLSLSESTPGAPVIRAQIEAVAEPAAAPRPVRLEPRRARAIADLPTGFRYTAPANLVLFLVMNGIIGGLAIIELRSRRIARRLLAMPVRTASILAGIAAGAFQSLAAQALFLIALTGLAFGVPWGDPLGVALLSGALVAFGTACSLFAGTFFRTAEQCMSLGPLVGIVLGMLGGCMWPLSVVPPWLREVSAYVPTTWALDAYLALGSLGAEARDVLPTAAALLAGAAVVGAAGLARLRRRLAD